jgi:hypothetical protein
MIQHVAVFASNTEPPVASYKESRKHLQASQDHESAAKVMPFVFLELQ